MTTRPIVSEKPPHPQGGKGSTLTLQISERLREKRQALVDPVIDAAVVIRELLVAVCDAELI